MTIGSRVMIAFPPKETTITKQVRKYDGKVTTIAEVRTRMLKKFRISTYILKGCKSEFGLDYEFLREWLVPLDEEVTE